MQTDSQRPAIIYGECTQVPRLIIDYCKVSTKKWIATQNMNLGSIWEYLSLNGKQHLYKLLYNSNINVEDDNIKMDH